MLLTEYDEKTVNEMFKEEGIAIGEKRGEKRGEERGVKLGEDRLSNLYKKLIEAGRTEDAQKAMLDEGFRNRLYKEFQV